MGESTPAGNRRWLLADDGPKTEIDNGVAGEVCRSGFSSVIIASGQFSQLEEEVGRPMATLELRLHSSG